MSIREVSVDELETALAAGGRVIDVREEHEYTEGHVPGAVLVVLSTVPDNVDAFRGEPAPFVICRSGARSMKACEHLAEHGVDAVNVAGGTMAWMMSGRPVVAGDQPS
jgi:rhodanese-related sulfurtransferase